MTSSGGGLEVAIPAAAASPEFILVLLLPLLTLVASSSSSSWSPVVPAGGGHDAFSLVSAFPRDHQRRRLARGRARNTQGGGVRKLASAFPGGKSNGGRRLRPNYISSGSGSNDLALLSPQSVAGGGGKHVFRPSEGPFREQPLDPFRYRPDGHRLPFSEQHSNDAILITAGSSPPVVFQMASSATQDVSLAAFFGANEKKPTTVAEPPQPTAVSTLQSQAADYYLPSSTESDEGAATLHIPGEPFEQYAENLTPPFVSSSPEEKLDNLRPAGGDGSAAVIYEDVYPPHKLPRWQEQLRAQRRERQRLLRARLRARERRRQRQVRQHLARQKHHQGYRRQQRAHSHSIPATDGDNSLIRDFLGISPTCTASDGFQFPCTFTPSCWLSGGVPHGGCGSVLYSCCVEPSLATRRVS